MSSSRTNLALSIFGAFLVSVGRIFGEYIVETRDVGKNINNGYDFENRIEIKNKYVTKRLVVLTFLATVIFGTGWDLILRFDNDKHAWIFGALIAFSQALSQFQDTTLFFKHPKLWSVFFQICIWASWILYVSMKNSFLLYRWFGLLLIFISNVYYNLIRNKDNIYKDIVRFLHIDDLLFVLLKIINCCEEIEVFDEESVQNNIFHFAFHFQLFGYVLISVANNI